DVITLGTTEEPPSASKTSLGHARDPVRLWLVRNDEVWRNECPAEQLDPRAASRFEFEHLNANIGVRKNPVVPTSRLRASEHKEVVACQHLSAGVADTYPSVRRELDTADVRDRGSTSSRENRQHRHDPNEPSRVHDVEQPNGLSFAAPASPAAARPSHDPPNAARSLPCRPETRSRVAQVSGRGMQVSLMLSRSRTPSVVNASALTTNLLRPAGTSRSTRPLHASPGAAVGSGRRPKASSKA